MLPISTRHRTGLPSPTRLAELVRSLAMLDALAEPDWEARWFSYDPEWESGVTMGSMRNGSGDWFALRFSEGGAVLRGFAHESEMSPFRSGRKGQIWPGVLKGVPERYDWAREADGFVAEEITFCLWYDDGWTLGPVRFPEGADPDGSEQMLGLLDDEPLSYVRFAKEMYELELDEPSVAAIYASVPLSEELLAALTPETSFAEARRLATEVGYPLANAANNAKRGR